MTHTMTHATARRVAPWLIVATTSLGFVVVQLDVSIVNVALTRIASGLGTGMAGVQWVVDAYALAFASLLLSGGALGDRIGARKVFVIGLVLFTAASLACGLAPSAGVLIAARVAQGAGAALLMPCSLALLNHAFAGDEAGRSRAIGLWTAAGGAALAAGPVIGGFMVDRLGWPSIFLINLPVGALGIWLTLRCLDETRIQADRGGIDAPGQVLAVVTLFTFTGTVIEAGELGWGSPYILGGLALAVAAGAAFLLAEARGRAPMLPLAFFRDTTFSVATFVGLAVNFAVYGVIFVLSFYFQQTLQYSPVRAGMAFLPFMAMVTLSNVFAGRIAAAKGVRLPMIAGLAIGAIGFALLTGVDAGTSYPSLIWRLLFIPAGVGLAVPPTTAALLATVPKSRSGVASGVLNTARQAAGAVGVALFGSLMIGDIVAGMRIAFAISAALLGIAAIATVLGVRPAPARSA